MQTMNLELQIMLYSIVSVISAKHKISKFQTWRLQKPWK